MEQPPPRTSEWQRAPDQAIRSLPPVATVPRPVEEPAPERTVEAAPTAERDQTERERVERERAGPEKAISVPDRKEPAASPAKGKDAEEAPDPFFGRPPDDPGVREPAAAERTTTNFRLF